ncbi:hypothetical protein JCM3766R1_001001 [Sporobolomyces carnicolor]
MDSLQKLVDYLVTAVEEGDVLFVLWWPREMRQLGQLARGINQPPADARYLIGVEPDVAADWLDEHLPTDPDVHFTGYNELPPPAKSLPQGPPPADSLLPFSQNQSPLTRSPHSAMPSPPSLSCKYEPPEELERPSSAHCDPPVRPRTMSSPPPQLYLIRLFDIPPTISYQSALRFARDAHGFNLDVERAKDSAEVTFFVRGEGAAHDACERLDGWIVQGQPIKARWRMWEEGEGRFGFDTYAAKASFYSKQRRRARERDRQGTTNEIGPYKPLSASFKKRKRSDDEQRASDDEEDEFGRMSVPFGATVPDEFSRGSLQAKEGNLSVFEVMPTWQIASPGGLVGGDGGGKGWTAVGERLVEEPVEKSG